MDKLLSTKKFWDVVLRKWKVNGCTHSHKFFRKILKQDFKCSKERINSIIDDFKMNHGYCDCEVILNAMEHYLGPKKYDQVWEKH